MAGRTTMTPVSVVTSGVAYTLAAVDNSNGNQFTGNDGNHVLLVANASGGDLTVTVKANGRSIDGYTLSDLTVVVSTATSKAIKIPVPASANQTDGYVYLNWSTGTSVTAAVLKMA